jgi:predicted component of type VI protein secretion system
MRARFHFLSIVLLTSILSGCSSGQSASTSSSGSEDYSNQTTETAPQANSEEDVFADAETNSEEQVSPDPETGVDIFSLPPGNSFTTAYDIGVEQAESFIATGGLTRATYVMLGGPNQSCKFILDSFMAYSGGSSTRQQYADFLLGCSTVVRSWY